MLTTWDGLVWYPQFYDMDTSLGLDNSGFMKFDVDVEVESGYFNTSASNLWTKVQRVFYNELRQQYKLMRQDRYTEENIMSYLYGNQISKIPQTYYNHDMQTKYLNFGASYLYACHGDRSQHMKRWIRERLIFMDTLFEYFASTNDFITIRANKLGYVYLDLQVYSPMYLTVKWRNQGNQNDEEESRKNKAGFEYKKVNRGETVRFSATLPTATDQEILVFGGRFLKDLGDLSNLQPSTLLISQAVNLTNVTCHSPNLTTTDFSTCTKLQTIDLSDCEQLGSGIGTSSTLNIADCTNLRSVNAFNTQLTAILTNLSGGNIEEIRFPYSVQTITVKNQPLLRSLGIPVYYTGRLADPNNRFVERLVGVEIANCERLESLVTNYCENNGVPVEVPAFLGVKYGQTFSISNSLTFLEQLDLSHCANLRSLSLSDFLHLKELNIDDITAWDAASSNLSQLTLTNCPNVETVTFNQNTLDRQNSLGVAFKEGTILDLSGLTRLKHVVSNVGVKGLKTLILPTSVVSLVFDFPNDTTYSQSFSDIENIWSAHANHQNDGFKGIDLIDMDTITDFSMGSLNLIERAENLNLKITKTFPYFNYHKTSNFFQPTGIVDISDYQDSLAHLFKGVDLDRLEIICTKQLSQQNASYMFSYAACTNPDKLTELFNFMTNITNLSYMFYQASITKAPLLPLTTTDCRYMFYNCTSMTSTPANWSQAYATTPLSEYCYTGCVNLNQLGNKPGSLDEIPSGWGGYGRTDVVHQGYEIEVNNTLERNIEVASLSGLSVMNLAPEYGVTPTMTNYKPSFAINEGIDSRILTQEAEFETAILHGHSLTNLASIKGETQEFERLTEQFEITNGLELGVEVVDGDFVEAKLHGNTLQNIVVEDGKTSKITNNAPSFKLEDHIANGELIADGDYSSMIIKGNTLTNIVPQYGQSDPVEITGTVKVNDLVSEGVITCDGEMEKAIIKGVSNYISVNGLVMSDVHIPPVANDGHLDMGTGEIMKSDVSKTTDYVVAPTSSFKIRGDNQYKHVCFYDVDKVFVKSNGSYANNNFNDTGLITPPTNAKYMRISFALSGIGSDEVVQVLDSNNNKLFVVFQIGSVKLPVLTTSNMGNLLKREQLQKGMFHNNTGNVMSGMDGIVSDFIPRNFNEYTVSHIGDWCWVKIFEYDEDNVFIQSTATRGNSHTSILNERTKFIRIGIEHSFSLVDTLDVKLCPYTSQNSQPYKTNILSTPSDLTLRGVGNVQDTLDCLTGEVSNNIGVAKLSLIPDADFGDFSPNGVNGILTNTANINIYKANFNKHFQPYKNGYNAISNFSPVKDTTYNKDYECFALHDDNTQSVQISLSHSRFNGDLTKEKMIQLIKELDITIVYELATPTIKTVDLSIVNQDGNDVEQLQAFKNGYVIASSQQLTPLLECTLPTSNYFSTPLMESNTDYTLYFDNEISSVNVGGNEVTSPISPMIVTSGSQKNVTFDGEPSQVMIIKGDVRNQTIHYFTGRKEIKNYTLITNNKYRFGKGGRK